MLTGDRSRKMHPAFEHRAMLRDALHNQRQGVLDRAKITPIVSDNPNDKTTEGTRLLAQAIINVLEKRLPYAEIVMWRSGIFSAATYGSEMFATAPPDRGILPESTQWWTFDGAINDTLRRATHGFRGSGDPSLLLQGVVVIPFGDPGHEAPDHAAVCYVMRAKDKGDKIPHLYLVPITAGFPVPLIGCPIIACLQFMTQQFVTTRKAHCGKAVKLPGRPAHRSEYSVVVLRSRKTRDPRDEHEASRDYHHCWQVRGHWRKLSQPRKSDGANVTYISQYLKGDPDDPFLPPRERIIRVKR
jgi:hypothetical protein